MLWCSFVAFGQRSSQQLRTRLVGVRAEVPSRDLLLFEAGLPITQPYLGLNESITNADVNCEIIFEGIEVPDLRPTVRSAFVRHSAVQGIVLTSKAWHVSELIWRENVPFIEYIRQVGLPAECCSDCDDMDGGHFLNVILVTSVKATCNPIYLQHLM